MSDLKGIAEIAEHLLYETLGLVFPGALLGLAGAAVVAPEAWPGLISFVGAHWALAAILAYTLGYVVQGVSRWVTSWWDAALVLPLRGSLLITRLVNEQVATWLEVWLRSHGRALIRRVRWSPRIGASEDLRGSTAAMASLAGESQDPVDLKALVADRLRVRLGLPGGSLFRPEDIRDLAFSALLSERGRLDRFRAATSFARGAATVVALGCAALMIALLLPPRAGGWPVTAADVSALVLLVVAYLALMERSSMYDALWSSIIAPQFLIASTCDAPPPKLRAGPTEA